MHNISYITAKIGLQCQEYKDAANSGSRERMEEIAERITMLVEELSEMGESAYNEDGVFFAGELDHHGNKFETEYPGNRSRSSVYVDESSKIPYSLCKKNGIEVEKGWTAREAWKALAKKGISATGEYKKFREDQRRCDAEDEEGGRWVTTEEDHRVHINEEGIPDKGNPYVLKAMMSGTKTREEIGRRKVEKLRKGIKNGIDAYKKADENVKKSAEKYDELEKRLRKIEKHLEYADKIYKRTLDKYGIKEGDREKLQKEVEELENKHKEDPYNREIEGEFNEKKFLLAEYEEAYGEETKQMRKELSGIEKEHDQAKKELDKHIRERRSALKEIREHTGRNVQSMRFFSQEERQKIKDGFLNGEGLRGLTDEDREMIGKSIDEASDAQLAVLQNTMKNARVYAVEDTARPDLCSHYSPSNGILYLQREDMGNPKVFWHEYGHYMDDFSHSGLEYSVVTHGEGTKYEGTSNTFTSVLESEVKLFGQDCADDLQDLFDRVAPGKFKVKTNGEENYISVTNAETGRYVDLYDELSFDLQKAFDKLIDEYIDGGPDGGEIGAYRRSIGYPSWDECPKREDYIESYETPKRKLKREREKFKGAEEEYYRKLREFYDKEELAKASDPDYNKKMSEMYERKRMREKLAPPVTDCLCAAMMGQVFSIYGCHDKGYYSTGYHAFNEWAANIHQMMFTGDKEAMEFMTRLLPRTMKKVEKAYNEYLWRNMSV